jgi:hypothetical protein
MGIALQRWADINARGQELARKKFEGILGLLQFPTCMYKALRLDVLVLLQNPETIVHF